MSYSIGPITDQIIQACVNEVKKEETKNKILNDILTPIINGVVCKYKVFLILLSLVLLIIIMLLVTIMCKIK